VRRWPPTKRVLKWGATSACALMLPLGVVSVFVSPYYDQTHWWVYLDCGCVYFAHVTFDADPQFVAYWEGRRRQLLGFGHKRSERVC
jgi:hypothetical protein